MHVAFGPRPANVDLPTEFARANDLRVRAGNSHACAPSAVDTWGQSGSPDSGNNQLRWIFCPGSPTMALCPGNSVTPSLELGRRAPSVVVSVQPCGRGCCVASAERTVPASIGRCPPESFVDLPARRLPHQRVLKKPITIAVIQLACDSSALPTLVARAGTLRSEMVALAGSRTTSSRMVLLATLVHAEREYRNQLGRGLGVARLWCSGVRGAPTG